MTVGYTQAVTLMDIGFMSNSGALENSATILFFSL